MRDAAQPTILVPIAQSGNYTEWETQQGCMRYCMIREEDIWTIMFLVDEGQWVDSAFDIDLFLRHFKLALVDEGERT